MRKALRGAWFVVTMLGWTVVGVLWVLAAIPLAILGWLAEQLGEAMASYWDWRHGIRPLSSAPREVRLKARAMMGMSGARISGPGSNTVEIIDRSAERGEKRDGEAGAGGADREGGDEGSEG